MSNLICKDCGYNMGNYDEVACQIKRCTNCGSQNLECVLIVCDLLTFHETVKGKSNKAPGKKKPYSEFQAGEEFSKRLHRFVTKTRKIDREHDSYYEKVSDPETGKILHDCSEPLHEHLGHGSDKFKKHKHWDKN